MNNWSLDDIIKSPVGHLNKHLTEKSYVKTQNSTGITSKSGKKSSVIIHKPSPQKDWLGLNLQYWANEKMVELVTEHKFHQQRKWRFDWAFPALKIAVEYNGIMSKKSRHTTVTGYSKDMEKINASQSLGWKVLQYTPMNYKNVINDLNNILCK